MIDGVNDLNRQLFERVGDPEINARTAQYEMAFRMQTSVPGLMDLAGEDAIGTEHVAEAIGYRLLDRAGPPA